MTHPPIQINNLSLAFAHKTCFEGFSSYIYPGSRIAIIGSNGSGKSTLLKILLQKFEASSGSILMPKEVSIGYVPQIIEEFASSSGGQRFNKALSAALKKYPNLLLLDEPTNHLDLHNRKSLIQMLKSYNETLIIVSHDTELLRHSVDILWHIDDSKIHVFTGNYDDYMKEKRSKYVAIQHELSHLNMQKKEIHNSLMQEQKRAASSKNQGKKHILQRKWPTVTSSTKAMRGEETSGRKKSAIDSKKQELEQQLSNLRLPEIIVAKFSLNAADIGMKTILSISNGSVSYQDDQPLLNNINLSLFAKERIAITGNNGSGKSTLIRAIINDSDIIRTGNWYSPQSSEIGYLDQHYNALLANESVLESITKLVPSWSHAEVRKHLNDFLFRKNEEVNNLVENLSGGEKLRLSLAQIAAKTPKLLLLDEVTNNIDLETKRHLIEVLQNYPGAIVIISHDPDFLKAISVNERYHLYSP